MNDLELKDDSPSSKQTREREFGKIRKLNENLKKKKKVKSRDLYVCVRSPVPSLLSHSFESLLIPAQVISKFLIAC